MNASSHDPDGRQILTVAELNGIVREILEGSLLPLWVVGEIGNLTIHRSGHVYLTLKDRDAQIKAVFFNGAALCRRLNLREGVKVEVYGKLSVYAARGEYQINIKTLQPCGIGTLQMRFEELKQRLAAEGLFDSSHKKSIPYPPLRIGLISSSSGAALKDFLKIALSRFPALEIRIYPAPVQGKGAEYGLAAGLRCFNEDRSHEKKVDVIVLTRGGGSLEDLWPFNEEVLARAIYESRIPVVSAVGHEIDFTIADFVADFRAPTPSGAAESLIPELQTIRGNLNSLAQRCRSATELAAERADGRLSRLRNSRVFRDSVALVTERMQSVDLMMKDAENHLKSALERAGSRLTHAEAELNAFSPYGVLKRGYSMLLSAEDGKVLTKSAEIRSGGKLRAVLSDGERMLTAD